MARWRLLRFWCYSHDLVILFTFSKPRLKKLCLRRNVRVEMDHLSGFDFVLNHVVSFFYYLVISQPVFLLCKWQKLALFFCLILLFFCFFWFFCLFLALKVQNSWCRLRMKFKWLILFHTSYIVREKEFKEKVLIRIQKQSSCVV